MVPKSAGVDLQGLEEVKDIYEEDLDSNEDDDDDDLTGT